MRSIKNDIAMIQITNSIYDSKTKTAMYIEDEYADDDRKFIKMDDGKTVECISKTLSIPEPQISELLNK